MLIKKDILKRIKDGEVSLAFRRWKRPTVKTGGTLRTSVGILDIYSVDPVEPQKISKEEAKRAGYPSKKALLNDLNRRKGGEVFRISIGYHGPDPRKLLQQQDDLTDEELAGIKKQLAALDRRSAAGPWTFSVLQQIRKNPGTKAADLAKHLPFEKEWLKTHIRKLKELGLTQSLSPGYRLSPRGEAVFAGLKRR